MKTLFNPIVLLVNIGLSMSVVAQSNIDDLIEPLKVHYQIPKKLSEPLNSDWVSLGKELFFDVRLSGPRTHSCATCHDPMRQWSDGQPKATGLNGQTLDRKTPALWNVVLGKSFFWDGRAADLEIQALGPITNPNEMDLSLVELESRMNAFYSDKFIHLGIHTVTAKDVGRALAHFQKSLVIKNTLFDDWLAGNSNALSVLAKRGLWIFHTKGDCARCHSGWNFTDEGFHDIGIVTEDLGRFNVTNNNSDRHRFKTPSLRNAMFKSHYFHNGSQSDMAGVFVHYNPGGSRGPSDIKPIALNLKERQELMAFMISLTER